MKRTNNNNLREICNTVLETIAKKNHDYDDAFAEAYDEIGNMYAVGKIFEKYKRINKLSREDAQVSGEGLDDALLDCIGYCLLYLDQRKQNGGH